MQTAMSTDTFIMGVIETLMTQLNDWAEQERLNQVKSVLYMHLHNKTILTDGLDQQLPAEWVDDTPHVIEMWLRCLQLERRTDKTLAMYRCEIGNMFRYLQKHYADIQTNDVRSYLSYCQVVRHNSDVTVNNKYHAICSFYSWIMAEDIVDEGGCLSRKPKKNPMAKIHKIKEEKKVRTLLTDGQAEIIRCDCQTLRNRAIVEILIATGMRISELIGLNVIDINIQEEKCIVYGKGRKERPAFFTARALVHLKAYMDERLKVMDCEPALFINPRKSAGVDGLQLYRRASAESIRKELKKIVASDERLAGLRIHPHMFRRYLATYMARHGASLDEIKNILGHSSVNTTLECYIVENVQEIQRAHGRFAA